MAEINAQTNAGTNAVEHDLVITRVGAMQGWNESFDRLAEYVGGRR
jgi:hypothetical protein